MQQKNTRNTRDFGQIYLKRFRDFGRILRYGMYWMKDGIPWEKMVGGLDYSESSRSGPAFMRICSTRRT